MAKDKKPVTKHVDVSDSEEEEVKVKKTNKKIAEDSDDDVKQTKKDDKKSKKPVDSDDEDEKPAPKKASKDEKPAPKKTDKKSKAVDSDDEDEKPAPKKTDKKSKALDSDDEDEKPAPKKTDKKSKAVDSDDEDEKPAPKKTDKKSKAVDSDDEDEKPAPKKTDKKSSKKDDDEDEKTAKKEDETEDAKTYSLDEAMELDFTLGNLMKGDAPARIPAFDNGDKIYVKVGPIKLSSRGMIHKIDATKNPKLEKYAKKQTQANRAKLQVAHDKAQKTAVKLFKFLEKADKHFGSKSAFKEFFVGTDYEKDTKNIEYDPMIRNPDEDSESYKKAVEANKEPEQFCNIKFETEYKKDLAEGQIGRITTTFFDDENKDIPASIKTVDEVCDFVPYNSTVCFVLCLSREHYYKIDKNRRLAVSLKLSSLTVVERNSSNKKQVKGNHFASLSKSKSEDTKTEDSDNEEPVKSSSVTKKDKDVKKSKVSKLEDSDDEDEDEDPKPKKSTKAKK